MKKVIFFLFTIISLNAAAQQKLLLRQPALNPDGTLVAFSYQGDIWTVPANGGKAARLTIHEAYESNPVFSPDGTKIAFSGARFGNNDIFVMPVTGGLSKRLTFHSNNDNISSWTLPNQIFFSTAREFMPFGSPTEVYSINPAGGTENRIMDAVGFSPVASPNGKFIAFVRGLSNPVARKDYRGSSNMDIWLYDVTKKTYHRLPGFSTNDILPQWSGNNLLYFLSSNEGAYNLYKLKIDAEGQATGMPERLTDYKDESIRYYSVSANGKAIVLERNMDLYLMKPDGGETSKINIEINTDERFDAKEQKTLSAGAESFAISPNGKLMAFVIRGEVFIKENDKDKSRTINVSDHPYRDVEPAWLNDSALIFCSDRDKGNFDIYLYRSSDTAEKNIFKSLKHELSRITNTEQDETSPVVSPDGKKIAYVRGKGTFVVSDISPSGILSGAKVLNDSWDAPRGISWSPDSRWLAYSLNDLDFNEEVFIRAADNSGQPVNVSMHPRRDNHPCWSPDGTKLGFISERSSARSADIYFVWLKKEDWEKESADWQDKEPQSNDLNNKPSGDKHEKKAMKPIVIDFSKIYERIVQVTNFPGNENDLAISKDGETFYYTTASSTAKGRDLYSIKWDGKDLKELTKGGSSPANVMMDREGKYLYYNKTGSLSRLEIKAGTSEALPFSAKMKIDYIAERTQVFEEAWRTIRDGFYDPGFHGYNWNKLHDKYWDRCIYASTSNDFRDMFNLMLGELNSSHMGLTAPDRAQTQKDATGFLGVELVPVDQGIQVVHVVPETPADKASGRLFDGDIITAVNGNPINPEANFYEYFNGMANEKILLTVLNAEGKSREVAIRPAESETAKLYEEWVENRKKLVDQFSNGRLGYIHIKSMDFPSFEVVEREFTAAGYGKEGLVIDVRNNGGGSTTDYLMTILNYKQHAYTIPRGASENLERDKKQFRSHYPIGERLVYAAWTRPSIALCNESSYSNAEIFSHAYQSLGIGKLVGVPTNGSVISTGGKSLVDGSFVRLPGRGWFVKATDKNEELGPAIPDIIVENQPDWISKGTDDQLKAAVDELLKEIGKKE